MLILGYKMHVNCVKKSYKIFFFIFSKFISKFSFHWGTNNEVLGIHFMLVKNSSKYIKN